MPTENANVQRCKFYAQFLAIKDLMPWVVRFDFEGKQCKSIQAFNLFDIA